MTITGWYPRLVIRFVVWLRVVTRRRIQPRRPGDYVSGDFLTGTVASDAPIGVAHVQHIAREVRDGLDELNLDIVDAAEHARLHRGTIHGILAGDSYPDVLTVARLEEVLDRSLWPAR